MMKEWKSQIDAQRQAWKELAVLANNGVLLGSSAMEFTFPRNAGRMPVSDLHAQEYVSSDDDVDEEDDIITPLPEFRSKPGTALQKSNPPKADEESPFISFCDMVEFTELRTRMLRTRRSELLKQIALAHVSVPPLPLPSLIKIQVHYSAVYGVRVLEVQPTIRFEDIRHLIEAEVLYPQDVVPHKLKYVDRDKTVIIQSDQELAAAFRTWWVGFGQHADPDQLAGKKLLAMDLFYHP